MSVLLISSTLEARTLSSKPKGEDGFEGIKLGPKPPSIALDEFQRHLLALSLRGVIVVFNSKSSPDDALRVVRGLPCMDLREENFASVIIN